MTSRGPAIYPWFFALSLLLGLLKLVGWFPWSWWWVLAPLWVPTAIAVLGSGLALLWVLGSMALRGGARKVP